ncbi:E1 ubiquitin-activating protein uba2 [Actinomortierella ambigua]|nr:E1 ubiquitin-activating protein uba2 [Actinomortierella ambigua]
MSREDYLKQTIGTSLVERIAQARVLMVGAGGIGCELLKNLVMSGFKNIEIIDLDTIDLSNLNRQFLFQKQHVKKSKANIAKASALAFNPSVNIVSRHQNIKEEEFTIEWFRGFDLVMNALDNLDARRHVNKMCLAANVPLIESGTAGYLGQVTVIKKEVTECFDCQPKETPKTFPVCTIRSTPSAPIHCIVWAKSYLFGQLLGNSEDDDDEVISKDGEVDGETAKELAALAAESQALKAILETANTSGFAQRVFDKVFYADIVRLRSMEEMWKTRKPPVPLKYKDVIESSEAQEPGPADSTPVPTTPASESNSGKSSGDASSSSMLKDQRQWSLLENVQVFCQSLEALTKRLQQMRESDVAASIQFDKDDPDALDFVTATSNLRAHIFGIEEKSRFQVKAMAGNIIPAIATTNAIIAGMMVMIAFKILNNQLEECKTGYLAYGRNRPKLIIQEPLAKPNPKCYICRNTFLDLRINADKFTVQDLVSALQENGMEEVEIQENGRLLYDVEFEDNLETALVKLGVTDEKLLEVLDDEDHKVVLRIVQTDEQQLGGKPYILEGDIAQALRQTADAEMADADGTTSSAAASAKEDDKVVESIPAKRKLESVVDPNDSSVAQKKQVPVEGAIDVDEVVMMDGEVYDLISLD